MDQAQEVMDIIDELYSIVAEAWGVPLGNEKCIVERDKVLGLLDEIKDKLPGELSEARRLVEQKKEFISNAKQQAEGLRHQAEERARVMVSEQEVVRVAEAKSSELMATTEQKVRQLREAASSFCVQALQDTEQAIAAAQQASQQAIAASQQAAQQAIAAAFQQSQQAIAAAQQQSDSSVLSALQNVQNIRAGVTSALAAEPRRPAQSEPQNLPQAEYADPVE